MTPIRICRVPDREKRRFVTRRSPIHGRGVFATDDIGKGVHLLDYEGERITWDEACARFERAGTTGHTFFFECGDDTVIDGGRRGNDARWINHGCDPNCEAVDDGERISIHTRRAIPAGQELLIDYSLTIDEPASEDDRAPYACVCGSRKCRGTMLSA